jgi:hypothetical protein
VLLTFALQKKQTTVRAWHARRTTEAAMGWTADP